jgi:hypothetical protein
MFYCVNLVMFYSFNSCLKNVSLIFHNTFDPLLQLGRLGQFTVKIELEVVDSGRQRGLAVQSVAEFFKENF